MPGVLGRGPGRRPVSALHLPLGWHARGDHAEVPDVELYGVEDPEVYDGVLFWVHQRCNTAWPRNADWEASVAAARAHNERGEG